jgi:uncharacterized protein YjbJ (UPF0337 family)
VYVKSVIRNRWSSPKRAQIRGPFGRAARFISITNMESEKMDADRIKGAAEQAKGKVKEVAGKVTGDSKTEAEGKADQVKGKVQNTVGGIKDSLKGE